jgi:hypothetical protein
MGVDFYVCSECSSTFPDCGEYYHCARCDELLCQSCGESGEVVKVCSGCGCACKSHEDEKYTPLHAECKCPCKGQKLQHDYDMYRREIGHKCICDCKPKKCAGGCLCDVKDCGCGSKEMTYIAICANCTSLEKDRDDGFAEWVAAKAGFSSGKEAKRAYEKETDEKFEAECPELKVDDKTRRVRIYAGGKMEHFGDHTHERFYPFPVYSDDEKEDDECDEEKKEDDDDENGKKEMPGDEREKESDSEPPQKKAKFETSAACLDE